MNIGIADIIAFVIVICVLFLSFGLERYLKTNERFCRLTETLYKHIGIMIACAIVVFLGSLPFIPHNIYISLAGIYAALFICSLRWLYVGREATEPTAEVKIARFRRAVLIWVVLVTILSICAAYWVIKDNKEKAANACKIHAYPADCNTAIPGCRIAPVSDTSDRNTAPPEQFRR